MQLSEVTWGEVEAYLTRDDRVILPVGSTEQHGPRAVIGTDFMTAEGIAARAGERAGVLVAPTLTYGMALHHMAFPGTISLRPSTLLAVTVDLLGSLARQGLRRVLVLNGHGGNIAALTAGIAEAADVYSELVVKNRAWWELAEVAEAIRAAFGDREGWHGTPGETSLVKALRPGLVSEEPVAVVETSIPRSWTNAPAWRNRFPDGSVASDVNLATPEIGERLLELAVAAVVEELGAW